MAVVTISRQFGAGGWTLAKKLVEHFGFELVTEDVIDDLARRQKVSPDWLKAVEKQASSKLLSTISSAVSSGIFYRIPSAPKEGFDGAEQKRYIEYLGQVMGAMADQGGFVIVGRGAQFVLKGHPKAIHVLLIAEYEDRVQFLMKGYSLSRPAAEDFIREKEGQRAAVGEKIFKSDINDLRLYHIVVNTSLVPFEWAEEAVSELVRKFLAKEKER
jgi:cytidylate kinase